MKRIDSVNARPDENGLGKAGFNDNADLPGQDATYVTPGWFNTVQEELCNLLELRGITLDPASKRQLYDLLTTQADLEALADEIETNFIRKSQIVDNLTTNDATKPVSAAQAKLLQDNKLDKVDLNDATVTQKGIVQLNNTLSSTSTSQALTAGQGKVLNDQAFGVGQTWQNVLANRVSGITYTNTTSKTITVYVEISSADSETITIQVDNVILSSGDWGIVGMRSVVSFPVPIGSTYKITTVNSIIRSWSELR